MKEESPGGPLSRLVMQSAVGEHGATMGAALLFGSEDEEMPNMPCGGAMH